MENEKRGPEGTGIKPSQKKIWIPPCLMAVLILVFSSTPGAYYPKHADYINNIAHLLEFAVLSFLLARALFYGTSLSGARLFLVTVAICVFFGFLDELHQFLVPERVFDLMDVLFDSLGAAAGSGAWVLFSTVTAGGSMTGAARNSEGYD